MLGLQSGMERAKEKFWVSNWGRTVLPVISETPQNLVQCTSLSGL